MFRKKNLWIVALLMVLAMVFVGCDPDSGSSTVEDTRPWADEDLVISNATDLGKLLVPRHLYNDNAYTNPVATPGDDVVSKTVNEGRFNFPGDTDIDNIGFRIDFPKADFEATDTNYDPKVNPVDVRYKTMTIEFELTAVTTLAAGQYAKFGFKTKAFPETKEDMTPYPLYEVWFGTPTAVSKVTDKGTIVVPLDNPNKAPLNAVWFTHNKYDGGDEWDGKKGSAGPIDYQFKVTKITFGAKALVIPEYTITFDTNGGIPATIPSVKVQQGYPIGEKMPANPTHATKAFVGWFIGDTDVEYTNTAITADLALKAKYADYDSKETTGTGDDAILTHYLPKFVQSTVAGHGEWAGTIAANGSAQYTGGAIAYMFPTEAADYNAVELYINVAGANRDAIIKQATSTTDVTQYPTGNQYPTLNVGTTKFGFVIAEAGTGIALQKNNATPEATFTLMKAVYKKVPTYQVTFTGGENTAMTAIPAQIIIKDRKASAPAKPVWDDTHDFVAWHVGAATGAEFDFGTAITADTALVAKWVEVTERTVSFDLNGATTPTTPIEDVTVDINGTLGAKYPTAPTKTDYTFDGWWDADNMVEYVATTVIGKDVTLKARWVLTARTANLEVPLTGLKVREDLTGGQHTGFWIDLTDALAGVNMADYDKFSVVIQRYDNQGNKVGNGWNIRLAFSTETISDFDPKDFTPDGDNEAEIQYLWWNINAASGQPGTNTPFEGANAGTAKDDPLTDSLTAIGLIKDTTGDYQDLALISLTLHAAE